jgi:peptide/nickel transport system substrate-binding protein
MISYKPNRREVVIGMAAATAIPAISSAKSMTPKSGGVLKISHSTRIATLNVMKLSGPAEYPCVDMLYSGLTRIAPGNNAADPDLATDWEANEDASEFTFNLRQGVTFHDGTPFTSADVVATYSAILDAEFGSPARSVLDMIDSVEAVGIHAVRFKLNTPYADLPISTAHANARIVSAAALAGDLNDLEIKPNGTGPFKLESYDSARITRLVRFDGYYKEGQPHLDAVEMHLFPDLTAETANYLSGEVDVMLNVQQADYARISDAPGSNALRVPSGRYVNVVMRQDQAPFDDVRVRKALAMSIDRQLLVDLVLEGLGRPANDNILSPEFQYVIDSPEIPYDPAAAKALLAQAGHPNGLKIEMAASNRPAIRGQVAIAIKEMARPAGFDIDVKAMPHDTYLANVWRKGNFYMAYWGMQPTEDATFNLLLTSKASYEDTGWHNAEFDDLVRRGRSISDPTERAAIYAKAQEIQLRDTPYIIAMYQDVLTASRDVVHGWSVHPLNRVFYVEDVWLDRG